MISNQPIEVLKQRFLAKIDKSGPNGCWIWLSSTNGRGYGQLSIRHGKPRYAHRIAYELFRGEIPHRVECLHTCDNPACVNPDHLVLGSHIDNMVDAAKKGRMSSKVTASQVIEMRMLRSSGCTLRVLAQKYGICISAVHANVTNKNWRHLETA